MKVLVVGGGGREHVILWKLLQDNPEIELHCAPGNGGITQIAECYPIKANDIKGLVALAKGLGIDLVIVGPEDPLVAGLVDRLQEEGIPAFGPSKEAAQIEGDKAFCKELLQRHRIPTADLFGIFEHPGIAKKCIWGLFASGKEGCVVKEAYPAGGKGVRVCFDEQTALQAIDDFMVKKIHGEAGKVVVIEEILKGWECTISVITDGETIRMLPPSKDHKPVHRFRGKSYGPNTGGMASASPVPAVTVELLDTIEDTIIKPTIAALKKAYCLYRGLLYVGLMFTSEGFKVLEINCRFGDPEAQVILPLLDSNLLELIMAVNDGTLNKTRVRWSDQKAVCTVLTSHGYPGPYETGYPIVGLDGFQDNQNLIFHAGTVYQDGKFFTADGRVIGSVGLSSNWRTALDRSLYGANQIGFPGKFFLQDLEGYFF